jgi:hypothetical protein
LQAPQTPQIIDPQFHLFTPESPLYQQNVSYWNTTSSIQSLVADFTRPLTLYVHGFSGDHSNLLLVAKDALLTKV